MIISDKRIKELLPAHYREAAPRFIIFLEKYYEWMFRSSGLSEAEVEDLRNDTSWLEGDIDQFIATGSLKYIDQNEDNAVVESSLLELSNQSNPGNLSNSLSAKHMLDDMNYNYLTTEGDEFSEQAGSKLELFSIENKVLDSWFRSMALDNIKRNRMDALNSLDQVLMLSLLKHIYAIKGTEASMKMFFNLFFNEQVSIYQPKPYIAVIDDNWILDDVQVLRDDELFQEFSYVIIVEDELASYKDIFTLIYMNMIHPSGFRVALVRSVDFVNGKINPQAQYLLG